MIESLLTTERKLYEFVSCDERIAIILYRVRRTIELDSSLTHL